MVKLVVNEGVTQEQMDKIRTEVVKEYSGVFGEDMEIAVQFIDRIPLTPAGKQKVVVSKLNQHRQDD
jgi:hypothetical protein